MTDQPANETDLTILDRARSDLSSALADVTLAELAELLLGCEAEGWSLRPESREAATEIAHRLYQALDRVLPTEIPAGPGYTKVPNSRLREGNEALEAWDVVPDRESFVTQKEAAARLGVHPNTVATMLSDGRLEPIDVGSGGGPLSGCRRVSLASLLPHLRPDPDQRPTHICSYGTIGYKPGTVCSCQGTHNPHEVIEVEWLLMCPDRLALLEAEFDHQEEEFDTYKRGVGALVATSSCLKRPKYKGEPWTGPCGKCAPCRARAAHYGTHEEGTPAYRAKNEANEANGATPAMRGPITTEARAVAAGMVAALDAWLQDLGPVEPVEVQEAMEAKRAELAATLATDPNEASKSDTAKRGTGHYPKEPPK